MNKTNSHVAYWQDVAQYKKVPLAQLRTKLCEVTNDAPSPSNTTTCINSKLDTPPDQPNNGPGIQQNQSKTTRKRKYITTKWSIEEKRTILHCFAYSRYEKWGRGKKVVFEEKIQSSTLPKETSTRYLVNQAAMKYK